MAVIPPTTAATAKPIGEVSPPIILIKPVIALPDSSAATDISAILSLKSP